MNNFLLLCVTFCSGYITGVSVTFVLEWMHERKALKDFERESTYLTNRKNRIVGGGVIHP